VKVAANVMTSTAIFRNPRNISRDYLNSVAYLRAMSLIWS
jgi:hypothetical protein